MCPIYCPSCFWKSHLSPVLFSSSLTLLCLALSCHYLSCLVVWPVAYIVKHLLLVSLPVVLPVLFSADLIPHWSHLVAWLICHLSGLICHLSCSAMCLVLSWSHPFACVVCHLSGHLFLSCCITHLVHHWSFPIITVYCPLLSITCPSLLLSTASLASI